MNNQESNMQQEGSYSRLSQTDPTHSGRSMFRTSYPLAIRLWHWLTFLTITASMVTVLFASTLFRTKANITMVLEQVQAKGGSISTLQARAVAHEYSDKLWNAHRYIGFGLCFLLLSRMVLEICLSKKQKLGFKIISALKLESAAHNQIPDQRHFILVKSGYLFFYLLFLVMAITGLVLAFEDVPLFKTWHRYASNIHSFAQYLIYLYISVHIIGVIRAEFTQSKGLVSAMINGGTGQ